MKKIVFFDLDDTLLTSKKEILPENIKAINKVKEEGIEVVICSGRQQKSLLKHQINSKAGKYIISVNGASIYDTENKEQLFACGIDEEFCIRLYEYVLQNNLFIRIDTIYARYINKKEYLILDDILFEEEDYKKFFRENKILQIEVGSKKSEEIDFLENQINKSENCYIVNRFMSGMLPETLDIIDIVNSSVSKGNAVLGLCKYLKIDPKDAVAFGDNYNDISMLKVVGYGVAMGNASDDLKAVAKEVITTNNEPGIAEVLYKVILNEEEK